MTTSFENQCSILAELWMNYRDDDEMSDFIEYNDIGLPMAYLITEEIVSPTQRSEIYIGETFSLFLNACNVEDTGFSSLDEIFDSTNEE